MDFNKKTTADTDNMSNKLSNLARNANTDNKGHMFVTFFAR